jgi:hypothetical protein
MEPNDLKSPAPDDALEAWLRTSSSLPPLPDDGFSRRVLAALPPPASRLSRRTWFCAGGALIGAVITVIGAATTPTAAAGPAFTAPELDLIGQLALPAALGVAALSLWFALRDRLPQLLRW